jgi:hypothetical protein
MEVIAKAGEASPSQCKILTLVIYGLKNFELPSGIWDG